MKPAPFGYHRAADVAHAVTLLAELGDEAKVLAGGQSLVPMMNFRLARPTALVDVNAVPGLDTIAVGEAGLHVGALVRHRALETCTDPELRDGFTVLPESAHWVGHFPIRTRGTFGGSLAHADPTAEWCLLALLLDAGLTATSVRGSRRVVAADWFRGFLTTALEADELLTAINFPRQRPHAALTEFALRRGDFAIVAAAAAFDLDADGRMADPRLVLGGVDAVPVRVPAAEELLAGARPAPDAFAAAGAQAARDIDPASDVHGDADYRRRLAAVLTERALAAALTPAGSAGAER